MSVRRLLERELIAGLGPRRRRALIERLRGNPGQRRGWDRAIAAFRALEQREVSRYEIAQVERWLLDDLDELGTLADARPRRRWSALAGLAAVAVVVAALSVWIEFGEPGEPALELARVEPPAPGVDDPTPRGGRSFTRPLAIDLVCGEPARPAQARGCRLDELLGFSARLGDEQLDRRAATALGEAPLHLSVFGIGAEGELLYYHPTPASPAGGALTLRLGAGWQALPMSIRIDVNHRPGLVRVFALASDAPASVADVERWAGSLAGRPPAQIDDPPWHLRLPPGELGLGSICARADRCASAETELNLTATALEPRTEL